MPFVAERQFIVATRETGYRTTSSAVAELIDNSLQAQAHRVDIRTRVSADSDGEQRVEVAVVDDGSGMNPDAVTRALRFGGTDRFDDRGGLGRFGMGLPNSSVSQARRVDVYSWEKRDRIFHSYLDVDEVAAGISTDVASAKRATIPDWINRRPSPSGTVVVWSKCDRVSSRRLDALRSRLAIAIGRSFRHFLWSGVEIRIDDELVTPIDPLLCQAPESAIGHADEVGRPLTYEVASPRSPHHTGKIVVRFSLLPVSNWSELSVDEKRRLGISKGAGISIVRAGREIAYGWHFMGQKRKENYDDWWRCEIRFEPELDELFGVTHSKQGIRPSNDLEAVLTPNLEAIAHDLNRRVRNEFTRLKSRTPQRAADLATSKDRYLAPLRRGVPLSAKTRNGVDYRVQSRALNGEGFFSTAVSRGRVSVTINKNHPFFELYSGAANNSSPDLRFAVDSMLLAIARAEQSLKTEEQRNTLRKCFHTWSDNLAAFLRK